MAMLKEFQVDRLKVNILSDRAAMGACAAEQIAAQMRELLAEKDEINMIFAAAPSQNETLASLIAAPGIDWSRINAFHMDEYVGLPADAPQGFGNFLKAAIFSKVPFKSVHYLDGQNPNAEEACAQYSALLQQYPTDIVCMGIGENGHIAFNDPDVADFNDPKMVKVVALDQICRQQQVNDGCFASIDQVPTHALTLTIPTLLRAPHLFCMVPAKTKAEAVFHTLRGEISEVCPASILRRQPHAVLFCDADSGAKVLFRKALITDEASQDFELAAKLAAYYGLEALEIRSVWDKTPQDLEDQDIEKINAIAKQYGLKICAISSSVFKCDLDDEAAVQKQYENLERCAKLAKKTGAEKIRAFTFWRKNGIEADLPVIAGYIRRAAEQIAPYGLELVIEFDPSVSACDADELAVLAKEHIPGVRVLWDPGNQIYNKKYKVPYPDGYELLKSEIAHVHLKDAVRDEQGEAKGVALGEGLLNVKGQLAALLRDGYDGYIVLEPHFRLQKELSEAQLALPGGTAFSDGGMEASELSMQNLNRLISEVVSDLS